MTRDELPGRGVHRRLAGLRAGAALDPAARASMSLVDRDEDLEADTLLRVARIAQEPGFPVTVQARLDDVERAGGPDGGGIETAAAAFGEARDEYVDGPAWTIIGLNHLAGELERSEVDPDHALQARLLAEEAMAHAAHAEHLMRGAIALLSPAE